MHWEKRWFQYLILLLLAFVWGSSFILMKVGLKSFTSYQVAAIRILLASTVLLPIAIKNLKHLKKKDLGSLLVAGFIGSFIPAFLFTKAQTRIDSALAGMLNSMTPIFALIIGLLFFRMKTGWKQLVGLFLGLLGAVGLMMQGEDFSIEGINTFALFIVLATLMYGANVNVIKSYLTHLNGARITSFSFMFLWPVSLVYVITADFRAVGSNPDWEYHLLAIAALGIIGTALAMMLMNSLIRYASAVFSASVTYIIPIFAIMWGIIDGESITMLHIVCMSIILTGVYLINQNQEGK
jgi:drug/metabolite transporter (DMT)-like permease